MDDRPSQMNNQHCIVLLHGLARTARSMAKMASAFEVRGYCVVNLNYPSRRDSIENLSKFALEEALRRCKVSPDEEQPGKIHFVTHSMGGILLRHYLAHHKIPNLGNSVLIAPPNQGSEVVDKLGKVPGFKLFNGPAGMQLGTDDKAIPRSLGPVDFHVGIIAGSRSINPLLSINLPKPNDGKVSVQSTRVEGMADFIECPLNHTFIMRNKNVIKQTILFIETGRFEH